MANGNVNILQPAPYKLEEAQKNIFSINALNFLEKIHNEFDDRINILYSERLKQKQRFSDQDVLPSFLTSKERSDKSWKIAPLPNRLQCRRVDIGDVSPSNTAHFVDTLNCDVQGVQVDFDDGHCPTWKNQIQGYHNIIQVVNGKLSGAPCSISTCPILMLRPRAWNIIEHNVLINGKEIPGALLDYAILMYHCGKKLTETGSGPFFYLSKLESASEAKLWNDIFIWSQNMLNIQQGTIKACVLIENILSAFETEEILYALKEHSLGLNCGIWDYIASIINKFGDRTSFILPDRKFVNLDCQFLKSYLLMIIEHCHARGAPATGGMAAAVLKPGSDASSPENLSIINKIIEVKQKEIMAGVDGFLIYDVQIIPYINELWKKQCATMPNQINILPGIKVSTMDLLTFPRGGVYLDGLKNNVAVSILFIYYWLAGVGHFFYNGNVEDSATAEISRCQVWQCVRHTIILEDTKQHVTYAVVERIASDFTSAGHRTLCRSNAERKRLSAAKYMCLELFFARHPPDFITTHLNDSHKFRTIQNKALLANHRSNL